MKTVQAFFFVVSEEKFALCPNCASHLAYHSRTIRPLKDISGTKKRYNIRVLRCDIDSCPTIYHRELPDIIVPYKRYGAESIEEAISQGNTHITVSADNSTIWRWRKWFKLNAIYIIMALMSVIVMIGDNVESSSLSILKNNSNNPIETIKELVSRRVKWLNETVRILVNSSKWIFNRSAFLPG